VSYPERRVVPRNAAAPGGPDATVRSVTRPVRRAVPLLGVAVAVALALLSAAPGAAPAPGGPPSGPTAVVVLGDSAASGEGAGDYEPGTRGKDGDWRTATPAF
jgi:hypothetical protein